MYPDPHTYTPEQAEVAAAIVQGPRGRLDPPLSMWLHSPAFAGVAQELGRYCRFDSSIPRSVSELVILVVASRWRAGFEWEVHALDAAAAGVAAHTIEALRRGAHPADLESRASAAFQFVTELLDGMVSDEAFDAAGRAFGQVGVVDLIAIAGYYTTIAMTIVAHRIPTADGRDPFRELRPSAPADADLHRTGGIAACES